MHRDPARPSLLILDGVIDHHDRRLLIDREAA
jgi:hypothetical protein